jgi:hypothetical protein
MHKKIFAGLIWWLQKKNPDGRMKSRVCHILNHGRRGFLCVHLVFTFEVLGRFAAKWRLFTIFLGGKFTVLVNSLFTINLEEQDRTRKNYHYSLWSTTY